MKLDSAYRLWPNPRNRETGRILPVAAVLGAMAIYAFASLGWGGRSAKPEPGPVLRCGYMEMTPYLHDTPAGPTGFAVDIMNHAAEIAGIQLQWKRASDAEKAIRAGQIDIFPVLATTKERSRDFHMSDAWWENEVVLMSRAAHPITGAASTENKRVLMRDRRVVLQMASAIFPRAILIPRGQPRDSFEAFCRGEGDAAFLDARLAQQLLLENVPCGKGALALAPLPEARLHLATASSHAKAAIADRLYNAIYQLSVEGWLTRKGAQYSLFSAVQSEYVRSSLKALHQSRSYQGILGVAALLLLLFLIEYFRMQRSHAATQAAKEAAEEVSAQLLESQQRFEAFMHYSPAIATLRDREGRLVYINQAGAKFAGCSAEQLIGTKERKGWPPDFAEVSRQNNQTVLDTQRPMQFVIKTPASLPSAAKAARLKHGLETDRELLVLKFPVPSRGGDWMVGTVALDVTNQRQSELVLSLSQFSIEHSPEAVFWVDSAGQILYVNSTACRIAGASKEDLKGRQISGILQGESFADWAKTWAQLHQNPSLSSEVDFIDATYSGIAGELSLHLVMAAEGVEFACALWRDITDRKQAERELYRQAFHDHLTGLPNRRLFLKILEREVEQACSSGQPLGVLFFDLDNFKLTNDQLGHTAGDGVLISVARTVSTLLGPSVTLGRTGGDEFTILLPGACVETCEQAARSVQSALRSGFVLPDSSSLSLSCSIGIAAQPQHASTSEELYHFADLALDEAKRAGRNRFVIYDSRMYVAKKQKAVLEQALAQAIRNGELLLHYQPQYRLRDRSIVRYEALIRWNRPGFGMVRPDQFIPLAEECGLIIPIGEWVLGAVCDQLTAWRDTGFDDIPIAINFSALHFAHPDMVSHVLNGLDKHQLPHRLLEVEITESALMIQIDESAHRIATLRDNGIAVSIDDFGSGYSSLSYLQRLPIDALKIDRTFTRTVDTDAKAVAMMRSMISLAHSLGLRTVVEGVERAQQLQVVAELGCDDAQGFLLGRPAPASELMSPAHARRLPELEAA